MDYMDDETIAALHDARAAIDAGVTQSLVEALRTACATRSHSTLFHAVAALIEAHSGSDREEVVRALERACGDDATHWLSVAIRDAKRRRRSAHARALAILRKARELLSAPGAWCQGAFARDERGAMTDALDPAARAWCVLGALAVAWERCGGGASDRIKDPVYLVAGRAVMDVLRQRTGYRSLIGWNDAATTAQSDVLALLDAAEKLI